MYCPSCGSEERQRTQFCRTCGTDLRAVRTTLERPDAITASAVSAREQISQIMAEKIAEMETAHDLERAAEGILPQIEKFLESPEEKRLRRVRAGVITASVGLAVTVVTLLMAMGKSDILPFASLGFVTFLIGLGLVINGLYFTVPRKELRGNPRDAPAQNALESQLNNFGRDALISPSITNELGASTVRGIPSVTEHTTHHLNQNK